MDLGGSITDAALAAVCWVAGWRLFSRGGPAAATGAVGAWLVAIAASLGTLRLGGVGGLDFAHLGTSRLAGMVGLPMVGLGWATAAFAPERARPVRSYGFVLLLIAAVLWIATPLWGTVAGGAGMALVFAGAARLGPREPVGAAAGAAGAALVLVAGLGIAGDGDLGPLTRIAWFHLALALAQTLLAVGLLRVDPKPAG